jgi:hypothetical protein
MQERRSKMLLVSLLLLITATVGVIYLRSEEEDSIVNKEEFKVPDLKTIDKIVLTSVHDTIELSFNGTRWLVGRQYPTDRNMIEVLFATLLQAEPKRAVASGQKDSVAALLKNAGVLVELFEKEASKLAFVAGSNPSQTQSYFQNKDGEVFIMAIPGYRVNVSAIYALPETEWRDKYVFGFNWTNFKRLETVFEGRPNYNFSVSMHDGYFGVEGMVTDTTKLNEYLDAVSLLQVDRYVVDTARQDMDNNSTMTITVFDIADRTWQLNVLNQVEGNRTPCVLKDGQLAWIDNRKLIPLMKNRGFFAKKP